MSRLNDFDPEKYKVNQSNQEEIEDSDFDPEKYKVSAKKSKERSSSPGFPLGFNIATGLASLAGKTGVQKEMIKNLPFSATNSSPSIGDIAAQGIGEYAPLSLSGIGEIAGLPGIAARIGATSGYGAAVNPENRVGGAEEGLLVGTAGELIPGALKSVGALAEKVRPVQFAEKQIGNLIEKFKEATSTQQGHYKKALSKLGEEPMVNTTDITKLITNPEDFLGYNKDDLSSTAKDLYDKFSKSPTDNNLHKLQSQLFRDSTVYKNDPSKLDAYRKALEFRRSLVDKIKNHLSKDKVALSEYEKGSDITRDIIKPFTENKNIRLIVKGKKTEVSPSQLNNYLKKALEVEKLDIPLEHPLRESQTLLKNRLNESELFNQAVPEALRKWSPNFAGLAQNPALLKILMGSNKIYQPIKKSIIANLLNPSGEQ